MLWGAFPDVFTGGISIVGLNVYRDATAGPGEIWRAAFSKPQGALAAQLPEVTVYKDPDCGCCTEWVASNTTGQPRACICGIERMSFTSRP